MDQTTYRSMIFHKNIRAHNLRVRYLMLSWLRRHLKMYIYVHLYPVTHKCFRMIPIHPWYGIKVTPTVPPFSVFPLKVRSVLSPSITLSAPLKCILYYWRPMPVVSQGWLMDFRMMRLGRHPKRHCQIVYIFAPRKRVRQECLVRTNHQHIQPSLLGR